MSVFGNTVVLDRESYDEFVEKYWKFHDEVKYLELRNIEKAGEILTLKNTIKDQDKTIVSLNTKMHELEDSDIKEVQRKLDIANGTIAKQIEAIVKANSREYELMSMIWGLQNSILYDVGFRAGKDAAKNREEELLENIAGLRAKEMSHTRRESEIKVLKQNLLDIVDQL